MDELRQWWAGVITWLINEMRAFWDWFTYGALHGWDIRYFVAAMGGVLLSGLLMLWRRKA